MSANEADECCGGDEEEADENALSTLILLLDMRRHCSTVK
jgi:hypothetical protein